jgi:hypothetical protein
MELLVNILTVVTSLIVIYEFLKNQLCSFQVNKKNLIYFWN